MESRPVIDPDSRAFSTPADLPPGLATLIRVAESVQEVDAIERMLLAYAVHDDGLGFVRAHLLLYDAVADQLLAWSGAAASHDGVPIDEAVSRAGLAPALVPAGASSRQVKWPADGLDGLAHIVWEREPVALHSSDHGANAEGAVLLRGAERKYGLIVGGWESEGDADRRHLRLGRFHAVVRRVLGAFERRAEERRAGRHVAALADLSRAAISSLNVAEVLHLAVETVGRDPAITGAGVWTAHGPDTLRLQLTHGPGGLRDRAGKALTPLATAAWTEQRPLWVEDTRAEPQLAPEWAEELAAAAALPIVAYGRAFGALVVYGRRDGRPRERSAFDAGMRRFLIALCDHVALALDQAERCAQVRQAAEREQEFRHRFQRIEDQIEFGAAAERRLAESRNPALSILAFARRAYAGMHENDPRREYLEIVMREAERLEAMLADQPPPLAARAPSVERIDPNDLVQRALRKLGETLVRRRIRLVKKLSSDVPELLLDVERVSEAITHLLGHAVETAAVGGRLKVESRVTGGHVVIELAHDGARDPGDALEQLFVAFATPGAHHDPNLGAAERIVREHGGEVRTRREGEWSSVIALTLPVRGNQDRRAASHERRGTGRDRRARFPESARG